MSRESRDLFDESFEEPIQEPIQEPSEETPGTPTQKNAPARRFNYYVSYLVVLAMMVCLAITAVHFLQWLVPTWDARGAVIACSLAAIEAAASHRLIRQLRSAQQQLVFYRVTEWVIIIAVLKLYTELSHGTQSFWANVQLWLVNFPENIFNGPFFLNLVPVLSIWIIANLFDDDLFLLGNLEESIREEGEHTITVRNLILRRFLNVGLLLVVFAGIPPQTVVNGPRPPDSNIAPAVVMYFILGIALLSLTRYSYLSTQWRLDRLSIPGNIPRRWIWYPVLVLGVLGVLIFLLPSDAGVGLLATLSFILGFFAKLAALLYALIFVIINAIARLFPSRPLTNPITPIVTPPPVQLLPPAEPSQTMKMIESILFWGGLAALIIIALRQYILFNKDLAEELKRFRPWRWFVLFWKRVTASMKKANKSVGIFVQNSLSRLRRIGRAPVSQNEWDFINPRRLNTRQKVIFYYLALVRRAEEAGLPRGQGQTPTEYARTLAPNLVEGKEAVEALTGSFIEARYSVHTLPREEGRRVESLWETVRRLLRSVRKSRREKDSQG